MKWATALGGGAIYMFLAATLTTQFTVAGDGALPHLRFPPDAGALCATYLPSAMRALAAAAIAGACIAAQATPRSGAGRPATLLLAIFNPIAIYAILLGVIGVLSFAAIVLLCSGVARLVQTREYGAVAGLSLAAGGAPLLSNSVLFYYPALFLALPLLSPWRYGLRRLAGMAIVVAAPLVFVCIAFSYLLWLSGERMTGPAGDWTNAYSPEALTLFAGAALIAAAGRFERRTLAMAAASVISGACLAVMLK